MTLRPYKFKKAYLPNQVCFKLNHLHFGTKDNQFKINLPGFQNVTYLRLGSNPVRSGFKVFVKGKSKTFWTFRRFWARVDRVGKSVAQTFIFIAK